MTDQEIIKALRNKHCEEVCQWVKVTHWMPLPEPPKEE